MSEETPRDLRKKNKRLKESRDGLKERNKEKALENKHLSGKVDDVSASRDMWKMRCQDAAVRNKQLSQDLLSVQEALDQEKARTMRLQDEILEVKKKVLR